MAPDNDNPDLVIVYRSQGPLGAEVARSKLNANGIDCLLRYQSIGRVFALTVDGIGMVEVLVNRQDALTARQLLDEGEEN